RRAGLSGASRRDHAAVEGGQRDSSHALIASLEVAREDSRENCMSGGTTAAMGLDQDTHVEPSASDIRLVIAASSAGTIFEWYDFFIYGTLAAIIGKAFFPADNATLQVLLVWAGFAVGFGFRPLGAI